MSLTGKDIVEIARLLDESRFSNLKLEMGDFKLKISRGGAGFGGQARDFEPESDDPAPPPLAAPAQATHSGPSAGEVDVPAPLLGNFYLSPRPGDPFFVKVGDVVAPDTTIGIIEVMKLMNAIRAGVSGTVTALLAEDGKAVEQGQPLIRVKTGG